MNFTFMSPLLEVLEFLSISKYTNAFFVWVVHEFKSVSELLWQILIWNTYLKLKLKYFIYHQQQHISEFFLSLSTCVHLLLCTRLKETRELSIFFFNIFYISFYIYFSSVFYVTFIVWRVMRFNSPCVLFFTLCFMRIITSFAFANRFTFYLDTISCWLTSKHFLLV